MTRPIRRLAIANRGEIACRIARTARSLGIETVGLIGPDDAGAPHTRITDRRVPVKSYLDPAETIAAARSAGADAVHPGYGFLSENAAFAEACAEAGLIFVGPSPEAIRIMGDKIAAKAAAQAAGVAVLPGSEGALEDIADVARAVETVGLPAMVKAAAGGGGKGMRIVRHGDEIDAAVRAAQSEARGAFADGRMFVERFVERPRHVEVQILADAHGTVLAVGDRDCSLQRRHQKILEEAPAPDLPAETRATLQAQSIALAQAVGYRGAGTVEFMVDAEGMAFFLEMNTRLQVEHPVTEAVFGLDLVAWMLRIAEGARLPADLVSAPNGHAVEARLYAEDSRRGFLPSTGRLTRVDLASGVPDLRVDSGVAPGQRLGSRYDPMIAKLIAWGPDRPTAYARLRAAVDRVRVDRVATNRDLLLDMLDRDLLSVDRLSTATFAETYGARFAPADAPAPSAVLAAAAYRALADRRALGLPTGPMTARADGATLTVSDAAVASVPGSADADAGVTVTGSPGPLAVESLGDLLRYRAIWGGRRWTVTVVPTALPEAQAQILSMAAANDDAATVISAPLAGTVTGISVSPGDRVAVGTPVARIEAMKMDHALTSETAGIVGRVRVAVGATVAADQPLIDIEEEP